MLLHRCRRQCRRCRCRWRRMHTCSHLAHIQAPQRTLHILGMLCILGMLRILGTPRILDTPRSLCTLPILGMVRILVTLRILGMVHIRTATALRRLARFLRTMGTRLDCSKTDPCLDQNCI